ncbi:MAG TPA: Re/Si-specific NAD(P)(+) transhydrogenase subunit alpha [Leptospiraceae bacterium]|nr:Re/Si-specific NAD(P)(+) transhydrogenase subunit alpha [Leptospiraceae bacterium]HRG76914.1 Re/Si-specific NAD(P)(+) transhydrogenase subunit alpha [Leptospiraceae bacterium]
MKFGILKETGEEKRVAMLPESVDALIKMGQSVLVEKGAGDTAYASDEDYKKVGATIVSKKELLAQAEAVIKIQLPDAEELDGLKPGTILFAVLQPLFNFQLIKLLNDKKVSVFSMDTIPRITRAQSMDILSSQATVAGYKAVLTAASHLPHFFPMLTTAAGAIPPSKMLIMGAGVAGLQAIATSKRLGAVTEVFDTRPEVKEQVMSLGGKFVEVEGAADASKAGGYAVEQTEDYKNRQREAIHKSAVKADVIITTAQIPGKKAPVLITEEMVKGMKAGSVIIDMAASTGGNCQLTENNKTIVAHGVTIIGNSNLQSTIPFDASKMFGKNIINFLKNMLSKEGKIELNFNDEIISGTCIAHAGEVRHKQTLDLINK